MIETFNTVVGIGTILLQVSLVVILVGWAIQAPFVQVVAKHAHTLLRVLFVSAAICSLIYEFGFGYTPCLLCWYQRIAIFPIAILSFTADIRRSALLRTQMLILGVVGFSIALFHNYIDIFPSNGLDVCGQGPSCLVRYVYEFGYITIPVMSATILLFAIVLTLLSKRYPQTPVVKTAI
jgi:disulfide bond formation protein DsbB